MILNTRRRLRTALSLLVACLLPASPGTLALAADGASGAGTIPLATGSGDSAARGAVSKSHARAFVFDLPVRAKTEHFLLRGEEADAAFLEELGASLESATERMASDLDIRPEEQISVHMFPDWDSYHQMIGEDYQDPTHYDGRTAICAISPRAGGDPDYIASAIEWDYVWATLNESGHAFGQLPTYLRIGLAAYETGSMEDALRRISGDVLAGNGATFEELRSLDDDFVAQTYGCVFCAFVADTNGVDALRSLLAGAPPEEALGMSGTDIGKAWDRYLEAACGAEEDPPEQGEFAFFDMRNGRGPGAGAARSLLGEPGDAVVEVVSPAGGLRSADDPIATGDGIRIARPDGTSRICTAVVRGDVTGTGRMSLSQLVRATGAFQGGTPLEGAYLLACDRDDNGAVSLSEVVAMSTMFRDSLSGRRMP